MDDTLGRDQGDGEADGCGGASEESGSHDPIELVVFSNARRPFGFGRSTVFCSLLLFLLHRSLFQQPEDDEDDDRPDRHSGPRTEEHAG